MSGKLGVVIGLIIGFLVCGIAALVGLGMARKEFDERAKRETDAAFQKGVQDGTKQAASMFTEINQGEIKKLREENDQLKKRIEELEKK
jgi:hypothetical protein